MESDGLILRVTPHPPGTVVAELTGEAGQPQEKALDRIAAELSARPEELVVLDLSKVTYISSVGLRTIIAIRHHKRAVNHTLALAAVPERIAGVLRRCKLDGQFATYPTVEAAITAAPARRKS
jgi:anti-anti-sigma factor